jgi:hypothetical protein
VEWRWRLADLLAIPTSRQSQRDFSERNAFSARRSPPEAYAYFDELLRSNDRPHAIAASRQA